NYFMGKQSKAEPVSKRKRAFTPAAPAAVISACAVGIHPELKDFLGYSLTKVGFRIRQRMEEILAPEGLVAPQCGILRLLERVGPLTQVDLGQHMLIDKATMVRMLDGLEDLGLAVRREHAEDRRAKVLTITAKGTKILQKIKVARMAAEDLVLAPLDAKEKVELKRILGKLAGQD
ncbi:MAG: MarR family transcriptional regulator, partial [Proteobacteria bacterium]